MDVSSLRALNLKFCPIPFSPCPLIRPALLANLKFIRKFSLPLLTSSSRLHSQINVSAGYRVMASCDKLLQVVLVSPQIPGNTGCIARTCAASSVGLHLVEPTKERIFIFFKRGHPSQGRLAHLLLFLKKKKRSGENISRELAPPTFHLQQQRKKRPLGYKIDDTKLKRAGLDYWPYVVVKVHGSWTEFREYFRQQEGEKRLLAFTKRGTNIHSDFSYRRGDWLVFGSETSGLPPEALLDCDREGMGGGTIRIPMVDTYVRCLNLSVSVGISLYEAARQLNYEQLQFPAGAASESQRLFTTEDIFG